MHLALLGTRGIPANYGGFETFYDNLAPRLVERGREVFVNNRPHAVGVYEDLFRKLTQGKKRGTRTR